MDESTSTESQWVLPTVARKLKPASNTSSISCYRLASLPVCTAASMIFSLLSTLENTRSSKTASVSSQQMRKAPLSAFNLYLRDDVRKEIKYKQAYRRYVRLLGRNAAAWAVMHVLRCGLNVSTFGGSFGIGSRFSPWQEMALQL